MPQDRPLALDRRSYLASLAAATALAGCSGPTSVGEPGATRTESSTGTEASAGEHQEVTVERVAEPFEAPWCVEPLPSGSLLVTERPGRLSVVDPTDGSRTELSGLPSIYAGGQGGLLDLALDPSFEENRRVYLTYSATNDAGESATHLGRGRLDVTGGRLAAFEQLHVARPFVDSDGHFGSRITFGPDGALYQTVGDRQFKNFGPDHVARDLGNELGTTLRLHPDGSIPSDNPFVDDPDAVDSIFSYGHRNAQGMTVHPETGAIWQSEYGEQDGDEINVVERGGDYGWPVADEGCTYGSGDPIGVSHDEREDVIAPVYSWPCGSGGFPPCGTTFYTGDGFPAWQGDLLVSGLASRYLARFTVDGREVVEQRPLLADRGWRIRDVAVGPERGVLYVAVDDGAAPIVRLSPT